MGTTITGLDLPALIAKGLAMVEERLRESGGEQIYDSIKAQLLYMKQTLESGAKPTADKLDGLTMATCAAREFETTDPPFADVLLDTEYLFKLHRTST